MNLALLLTWTRLLLTPVFAVVFFQGYLWSRISALVIVILSELTDLFDGIAARRRREVTDFGKILDPLADSVSRLTIFLCMAVEFAVGSGNRIAMYLVLCLLWRDAVVSTLRTVCAHKGVVVAARWSGKVKAVVQAVVIFAILGIRVLVGDSPPALEPYWFYNLLLAVASAVTVWSLYDYVAGNWEILKPVIFPKTPRAE
ncbi:MAG: CDP-alcohol phosphatidyltransferase family protein [Candidatus Omnitrophica bacterium]|nr:CDP-diacylglycerol--glycerol-3-phosphate 3-phosphatidyltransferase [bacterium]NUN96985.1 CDP-alcohol phosphatidyltransferase family protein [Candidatus Omnitrophota bacterium]